MAQPATTSSDSPAVAVSETRRVMSRLVWVYVALTIAVGALLILWPLQLAWIRPVLRAAAEASESGLGALVLATLFMVLTALLATLAMVIARQSVSAKR